MVDDYILNKVLDKIKEAAGIEMFDNTKILMDTDKNYQIILVLKSCCVCDMVIKNVNQFYPQLYLSHTLHEE